MHKGISDAMKRTSKKRALRKRMTLMWISSKVTQFDGAATPTVSRSTGRFVDGVAAARTAIRLK